MIPCWTWSDHFSMGAFQQAWHLSSYFTVPDLLFLDCKRASELSITNQPNGPEDLDKMVVTTLGRNIDGFQKVYRFSIYGKFDRSGLAIIFCFWSIVLHVSYPSGMLPMNPRYIRTSSRWWVLLWKDYWWFQVGLSNFDFRQIWHFTIHVRDYPHAMTISIMYHTQIPQRIWCWGFGAADKMHHMKVRFMQCFITISLWQIDILY